jgi:hypothetical protein
MCVDATKTGGVIAASLEMGGAVPYHMQWKTEDEWRTVPSLDIADNEPMRGSGIGKHGGCPTSTIET